MASLLSWLGNAARDVFDANTVADQKRRLAAGQPRYYQQQKPNAPSNLLGQVVQHGQAAVAQGNPLDGGRTYNTVRQQGADFAPNPVASVLNQVTHNGITNAAGDLVHGIVDQTVALPKSLYGIGRIGVADITGNDIAAENARNYTDIQEGKFFQPIARPLAQAAITLHHPFEQYTAQPKGHTQQVLLGDTPVQNIQAGVASTYQNRTDLPLPQRVITAGAYGLGQAAQDALAFQGAKAAVKPSVDTAVKTTAKAAEPVVQRAKDLGLKRPTPLTDPELLASQKVLAARSGQVSPMDITSQEAQLFHNAQVKLGVKPGTPQGFSAVDQALGAHRTFETQLQQRAQALREAKQRLAVNNEIGAVGKNVKATGNMGELPAGNTVGPVRSMSQPIQGSVPFDTPLQAGKAKAAPTQQVANRGEANVGVDRTLQEQPQTKLASQQVAISTVMPSNMRERGFIQTVLNDPNTSPKVKNSISSLYSVRNTKDLQTKAANLVKVNPDVALRVAREDKTDIGVATGSELIKHLQNTGQYETAIDVATNLAESLTKAGQTAQAASIYGKLTPEGILRFTQRELNKYNETMKLKGGNKLTLTPEQAKILSDKAKAIQDMPEGRARNIATKEMLNEVYSLMPAAWVQKVSTLQTIAQLLNPKTLIRNIGGNTMFGGLDNVSQVLAAGLDKTASFKTKTRTTALPNMKTQFKGLGTGAKQGYEEAVKGINLGPNTQFELNDVPTFRNGFMGGVEKTMGVALRAPDRAAYQAAFDDTVKGLMKANKLDKPTPDILELANANGLYRTFQDNSKAAQLFSGLKKALNQVGFEKNGHSFGLGDLILKYPKTPGNIISRGLDYSPVGIVKGLYQFVKPAITGQPFDQHTFANMTARGIVGTGSLIGAGTVLGALGIITEKPSQDTDTRNLQKASGLGGYQINVSALRRFFASGFDPKSAKLQKGDTLVSYDWAQPLAIPLSAGAAVGKGQNPKDGATDAVGNLSSGLNTLVEQPLITGVNTLANNIKNYGVVGAIGKAVQGAPASFVPTASNQVRQLTDNTTRSTYDPSSLWGSVNQVINRVPFADRSLNPQVDTLGNNKQNYQNGSNNILNVAFNPAFVNKYQPNQAAQLPLNILDKSGNTEQMPRTVKTTIQVNGKSLKLTGKQNEEYQRYVGQKTNDLLNRMSKDKSFLALSPDEQAKKISSQLTDINTAAKMVLFGNKPKQSSANAKAIATGYQPSYKTTISGTGDTPAQKYQTALKNYQTNSKNMTDVQKFAAEQNLKSLKVQAPFPSDVIKLYGMSKADAYQFLTTNKNGKKLADQLIAYDKARYNAGLSKYMKYDNGIAPAKKGRKSRSGSRSKGATKQSLSTVLSTLKSTNATTSPIKAPSKPNITVKTNKLPAKYRQTALKQYKVTGPRVPKIA